MVYTYEYIFTSRGLDLQNISVMGQSTSPVISKKVEYLNGSPTGKEELVPYSMTVSGDIQAVLQNLQNGDRAVIFLEHTTNVEDRSGMIHLTQEITEKTVDLSVNQLGPMYAHVELAVTANSGYYDDEFAAYDPETDTGGAGYCDNSMINLDNIRTLEISISPQYPGMDNTYSIELYEAGATGKPLIGLSGFKGLSSDGEILFNNGDFLLATFNGDYVYDYNQGTKVGWVCVNGNTSKAFLLTIKH